MAIDGLFWGLIALIDVALWLADTTRQCMDRDVHAIALGAFAQAHEPLPELLALAPAPGLELAVSDTTVSALALCSARVPMSLHSSIDSNDSVRRWVAAALPLVLPFIVEAGSVVPVVPSVTEAAPVVKKSRQSTNKTTDIKTATAKAPRKRSQRTAAAR